MVTVVHDCPLNVVHLLVVLFLVASALVNEDEVHADSGSRTANIVCGIDAVWLTDTTFLCVCVCVCVYVCVCVCTLPYTLATTLCTSFYKTPIVCCEQNSMNGC